MVAKRRKCQKYANDWERVKAMLDALPESDEDPALFWGPDWREKLQESEDDIKAGRVRRFCSDEEFLAALEELDRNHADS